MRKDIIKKLSIVLGLTLISLIISYSICEPIAFNNGMSLQDKLNNKLFIIIFVVYTIFLLLIWNAIIEFIIKLKNKDKNVLIFIKHFCIYFLVMFIVLLVMWPGHIVWDEMYVIEYTENYSIFMWQSVITQLYYGIALLIFPSVISIVVLQIIFISLIVAYIQMKIETIYNKRTFNIIFYVLLLIPSVIANNLYILRLPMYSYITLLFFAMILFKHIENNSFSIKQILLLILTSVIMVLWRSEGLVFIIFAPLIIGFGYKKLNIALKIAGIFFISMIVSYIGFNKVFKENEDKSYSLLVYVNPLSNMLQEDINVTDKDLEAIDKVMDIELIKQNPSYTETPSYWNGRLIRDDYKDNLSNTTKSYIKIILKNPISFIKARFATFFASSGMDGKVIPQVENRFLNHIAGKENNNFIEEFCSKHNGMKPIFKNLKINIESFLNGENVRTGEQNQFMKVVFWNFIPVLLIILFIGIMNLFKRNWLVAIMCISLIAKSGLVFLTAPASYFMYYFPEYIIGFLIICITIYENTKNVEVKESDRIVKEK